MALNISAGARYKNFDPQTVTSTSASQTVFPTPTATVVKKPEAIFVQAFSQNSGRIFIGKTGVATDGTTGGWELAAGANMTLPVNDYASLFHKATAAGQILFITYLESVV